MDMARAGGWQIGGSGIKDIEMEQRYADQGSWNGGKWGMSGEARGLRLMTATGTTGTKWCSHGIFHLTILHLVTDILVPNKVMSLAFKVL